MGYTVLGLAAGGAAIGSEGARSLALQGAVIEMVAHGLITGSLFLIAGVFWTRARDYGIDAYGGLAGVAPWLAGATILAAFASFGLPALAGFVAEVQIFAGAFGVWPWLVAPAVLGVVITAALFLRMIRALFFGELPMRRASFPDLRGDEKAVLGALLVLVVVIGVWPAWLIETVKVTAEAIASGAGEVGASGAGEAVAEAR
jgi:NADH-quinone oxidoreductase subunit M